MAAPSMLLRSARMVVVDEFLGRVWGYGWALSRVDDILLLFDRFNIVDGIISEYKRMIRVLIFCWPSFYKGIRWLQ